MKTLMMAGAVGAALALAGCAQTPESAATTGRLNCPETKGELTRISQSDDGQTCQYRTQDGANVELRLVPVTGGDPMAVLAKLQAELEAAAPPAGLATTASAVQADQELTVAVNLANQAIAQAKADAGGEDVTVEMSLPVGKIDATDEAVSINMPGVKIDANEDQAQVRIGPINIDASEDGATVQVYREVRLRGEALSRERRGIRATYILAGGRQPAGTTYVGLEAGGPKTGPLTVALVTSATEHEKGEILEDIQDLVRDNGGV
ncbi:MAG: hypothetical protein MH112_07850 [Phenylobacterium sp.]|uniref:hypothetical protein n=1 Tax=Phenylobacterium sp. TaxID=1871053 RepID=UPI0025F39B13|nr:hypothetical protein [Phenylobacterium sp.]MCG9916254.1 hypothetical protein [Phenylobacterium sp.]